MKPQRYSVVIPARNPGDLLTRLLRSLEASTSDVDFEVILSDDGSTDGAVVEAAAQTWPFPVRLVRNVGASGAGAARNRGVAASDRDIIVFVDADDEVAAGFVAAMGRPIERGEADIVGAQRDFDSLNTHLPLAAAILRGASSSPAPVEAGSDLVVSGGSGMAVPRRLFNECGQFDERLLRRQDHDFWLRAQSSGLRTGYAPDAVVRVRRRETVRSQLGQRRIAARASCLFFALHPELGASRRIWARSATLWWLLPRLHYLLLASRRTVWLGGLARCVGRAQGTVDVWRMRRSGTLVPWAEVRTAEVPGAATRSVP